MIYSKSSAYAIRAAVYLAQLSGGEYGMAKDIAQAEDIPAPFLAKILQELSRKGVLLSVKGPSGGFRLKGKPSEIRLLDIVAAIDGTSHYGKCIACFDVASAKDSCALHDSWTTLHSRIMEFLERNTIGNLVKSISAKQKASTKRVKRPSESRKSLRSSQ